MYKIRNNEIEIISLFRKNYKTRFYLREISKLSKLPLRTCQNTLRKLELSKILKSKLEGKNKYFFLNLENIHTKHYLLQAEIHLTNFFLEKYSQFKIFLKSLNLTTPLFIFGSFAKLTTNKNSDMDLIVIANKEPNFPFHLLPFKPHLFIMTEKAFCKAIKNQENLIKELEENHIILNNHSFYVNVMWSHYGN